MRFQMYITNLEASASVLQGTTKQVLLTASKEDSGTAFKEDPGTASTYRSSL